jgi:hypothetical protein
MDTKNWELFRSVFTEDVEMDVTDGFSPRDYKGAYIGPGAGPDSPSQPAMFHKGVDVFITALMPSLEGCSTVHHGHMPEIEILSETEAKGVWAMEDMLRWAPGAPIKTLHGYGHYHERYRRVNGQWKIAQLKLTRLRIDVETA